MHLESLIWQSFCWLHSGDYFTNDITEWLHISNMEKAYRTINTVNNNRQIPKHNDWCIGPDLMEETLSYLAHQGRYDIDSGKVFTLLSATDKRQNTGRAHLPHRQHFHEEPFYHPVPPQVHHLRETHIRGVWRGINIISLWDASDDFGVPNFGYLFRAQCEEDWGHDVCGLVLGYDHNVLIDSTFLKLQNERLYYHQPFHSPTLAECLGRNCKVQYTDANHWMMPESHRMWVPYMESDLKQTFKGFIPSHSVLYVGWTPPNKILQFQERLPARNMMLTFSKRSKKISL